MKPRRKQVRCEFNLYPLYEENDVSYMMRCVEREKVVKLIRQIDAFISFTGDSLQKPQDIQVLQDRSWNANDIEEEQHHGLFGCLKQIVNQFQHTSLCKWRQH